MSVVMDSLVRRYDTIKPHLTERQRRIWLGSEARELGSGGVGIVADAVGVAGIKISDREMAALPITRDEFHGDWNYTLRPTSDTPAPN